ncbi:MAG: DUF86 domain-containing protein [Thermostichus sp. BF3_bins_97]
MSEIEQAVLERKLAAILRYLELLAAKGNLGLEAYLKEFEQQLITERLLHLLVEAATDINSYILVRLGEPAPGNYFESFIAMGNRGVLTPELAQKLAPATGLRNRLVHEYDGINPSLVYGSIPLALELFPLFVEQIQAFLQEQS